MSEIACAKSEAARLSDFYRATRKPKAHSISRRRTLCEVGINDADYVVGDSKIGKCQAHSHWSDMITRCYRLSKMRAFPTYEKCTVNKSWHSFMAFREWWVLNHVDGWSLDKDLLLVGNDTYGPDLCIFVPPQINSFLLDCSASRGKWPIGVDFDKRRLKFRARCSDGHGLPIHLGVFNCPIEANNAWASKKIEILESLKCQMDQIDTRIYKNAMSVINGRIAGGE